MNSIFNMNSRLWRLFEFLADMLVANVLFILTSIPVITMGASITALYAVMFDRCEKKLDSAGRRFLGAFKENFLQSTLIWIFYLGFLLLCFLNIYAKDAYMPVNKSIILIILGVLLFLLTVVLLFSLAMTARFDNGLVDTVLKAMVIGVLNVPYAVVIILMIAAAAVLSLGSGASLLVSMSVWLTVGFGLMGYFSCLMFLRAFRRVTNREDIREDSEIEKMYWVIEEDKRKKLERRKKEVKEK